jgi:hypothetical protein
MVFLTLCMTMISLSNVLDDDTRTIAPPIDATYFDQLSYRPITPVILALLATLLMGINMNIAKYYDRKGFPADVFVFGCYGVTNFFQALISLYYFYLYGFNENFFICGFCGSFLNTLGLAAVAIAVSSGLSGPSSALVNL